ncbi:uncharacterized protein [Triticum aestivum]|uniref:uncharacterized protein n=1 Tax=Triticum aestivum TaxID=4565 RepID=UPI001D02CD40|nr:uncharacterized protein LOC123110659 [Triticum aestivum]
MAGLGSPPASDSPGGWGELPVDILIVLVFDYLDCFKDRLAVAGVCKAWRRVVSDLRAPPIPWLLLPHRGALPPSFVCLLGNGGNPHDHPVPAILHHMPRHISSARQGGWILVGTKDRNYELVNFNSGARLSLPHCMRDIRDRISDQRFVRISAAAISPPPPGLGYVDPTALSDSTSAALHVSPLYETEYTIPVPGFTIAAIMVGNTQLAFWPLANGTIWTPAPRNAGGLAGGLEDVIFYNESFCVLTRNENILKYHMPQAQNRACTVCARGGASSIQGHPESRLSRSLPAS